MNISKRMLGYLPIPRGIEYPRQNAHPPAYGHLSCLFLFVLSAVSCILGGFIGAAISRNPSCVGSILQQPNIGPQPVPNIPLDTIIAVFVYNRTFGEDPWHGGDSDGAWDSIVPRMYKPPGDQVYYVR